LGSLGKTVQVMLFYKTPWNGDPRVNIQNNNRMAKSYQVKHVLDAIERLENETTSE
jgi:hypothetical protein